MQERNPTWQKRQWPLERGLTVVRMTGVLLCIAQAIGTDSVPAFIVIAYFIKVVPAETKMSSSTAEALGDRPPAKDMQNVSSEAGSEDLCLSAECIKSASIILNNMDPDVDPCDNFYRFACGRFLNTTFLPNNTEYVNSFGIAGDKLNEQLRAIVEEPSELNERKSIRLVKNLYKSCMDETAIENQGMELFHKALKKFGGWPVLDGVLWNEADFDWINSIYKFRDAGYPFDYLFNFKVAVDWHNKTMRRVFLDTVKFGLSFDYLSEGVDNKKVKAYYDYMVDIAVLLGAEKERASSELMKSLLFEIKLAEISLPFKEQYPQIKLYTLMSLDELANNYSSIPWREYFSNLLPKTITVEENETAFVTVPSFFSDLEKLLCKTPKRVQANYLIWRVVHDSTMYLASDILKRRLAYTATLTEKYVTKSRWQQCVGYVSDRLPAAVGAIYVKKYFLKEAKHYVTDMVNDVKKEFYKIMKQVDWMDDELRDSSLEKLQTIDSYVGYNDELLDDAKLDELYNNLELSGGNFLDSILNITYFNVENSFGRLHEPVNKSASNIDAQPAIVKAFYIHYLNTIYLPAAFLQGNYFNSNRPRYMNYGTIGWVIGHEIAHGFDYMEYKFNETGSLSNFSSTKDIYREKIQCLIHQYGNYTDEETGLNLDGIRTRYDNDADNAGIKQAYLAYNDWAEKNGPEKKLPGLLYSPKQMFWISAANMWCTKWDLEALKAYITKDEHSTSEFRVLGPFSNRPEFSKDFKCSLGSKMNPEEKCSVW